MPVPLLPECVFRAAAHHRRWNLPVDDEDIAAIARSYLDEEEFYGPHMQSSVERLRFARRVGMMFIEELERRIEPSLSNQAVKVSDKDFDWMFIPRFRAGDVFVCADVGSNISAEHRLAEMYPDAMVHVLDPTPKAVARFADDLPAANMIYAATGLGGEDGIARFYSPDFPGVGSLSTNNLLPGDRYEELKIARVGTYLADAGVEPDRLGYLKFDIEGSEHEVIGDLIASEIRPRQIAFEFDQPVPPWTMERSLKKLVRNGYVLVSVWGTNVLLAREDFLRA